MKRSAFTLIEMVVVVLILGIMAAVAAPRMFNKAEAAAENATRSQLNVLRNAIELYASENDGAYPLPTNTDTLGDLLSNYINGEFPAPQIGSTAGDANVLVITSGEPADSADDTNGEGWIYNSTTGKISINSESLSSDSTKFSAW